MIEQFSQINVGVTFCYDFKMWLFTYLVILYPLAYKQWRQRSLEFSSVEAPLINMVLKFFIFQRKQP